jgi:hypothetical protein
LPFKLFALLAANFDVKPKGRYVRRNLTSSLVIFPSLSKSYLKKHKLIRNESLNKTYNE